MLNEINDPNITLRPDLVGFHGQTIIHKPEKKLFNTNG